jgi:hypothetical protein
MSFVKYIGFFSNPKRNTITALLRIHEKELLLKEKGSYDDITVKKVTPTHLVVEYKNRQFTIQREKP